LVETNTIIAAFKGVEKTFDGVNNVVSNLNLDIQRGEFLTLLGPSGSGKTTTLMMLAGFESPTAGEIFLNGRSLNNVPPYTRNMGFVFQNYALFPHMTVAENLAFPLIQRRLPRAVIQEKVVQMLQMVELDEMRGRRPRQLSGGQQQRVALARALVFEPDLVLMDEPLGALDLKLREQMQLEIKHIHDALGMTVVYVTHDQGEALTMSDRVAIYNQGIIQHVGSPSTVYELPANSFVANFVGENNRLHGTVDNEEGSTVVVVLDTGERVIARRGPAGIGDRTTLSIRPERVVLSSREGEYPNQFRATVNELIYFGDYTKVRMNLAGNNDFMVKLPITASNLVDLKVGGSIEVCWNPEHCLALDAI